MTLTKRGEIVLALAFFAGLALFLWTGYQIVNHLWWVEGQGYCWGTLNECMGENNG